MDKRPLKPVKPRKRMDAKTKQILRLRAIIEKAARRAYSRRYRQSHRQELEKRARLARERHARGDMRLTRYPRIK